MASNDVDDYLAELPEAARSSLEDLRAKILDLRPDAEECLSYGVPGYRVDGTVIAGFAAATKHLSYFPHSGEVLPGLADVLEGHSWSKGTLRFPIGETLPRPLVEKLLTARIALAN